MKRAGLKVEKFYSECRRQAIDPRLRLLLTTDGTVVHFLQALFLNPIKLLLQEQHEIVIEDSLSDWLEIPRGEKGFERKAWLTQGEKKVFAISTFQTSHLKPDFYQEIKLGEKAIGEIIREQGLLTRRDRLEIFHLPQPEVAGALGLPEKELFWARRYRLTIAEQASGAIFEVFSPTLFSSSS